MKHDIKELQEISSHSAS